MHTRALDSLSIKMDIHSTDITVRSALPSVVTGGVFSIPLVILDACQTAMMDEKAGHPFASTAAALVASGVPSVLAMSYSIKISAAREFFPLFYKCLFETGSVSEAAEMGRLQMSRQPERICARGKFWLEDWLVPVLYQQEYLDFSFVKDANRPVDSKIQLPGQIVSEPMPFGFIGRDNEILSMERAIRQDKPAILVHGGTGKTTLAIGFLKWFADTRGLKHAPLKSITGFAECNDSHRFQLYSETFMETWHQAPLEVKKILKILWEKNLGQFPQTDIKIFQMN